MTVSFNHIPDNIRVPLFYCEVDNSQAGTQDQNARTLLIGQKLTSGSAEPDRPYLVTTSDRAKSLFGLGSMLARMHEIYRLGDSFGEVWCIAVDDPAAGHAASGAITVTGTAGAAGIVTLHVAGQRVQAPVDAGATGASIAAAIAAAITANASLPVTASIEGARVDLTAKWKGESGNDITLLVNFDGEVTGQTLPSGIGLAITAMAGGIASPDLALAIAAMGDEEYDHVVFPFSDTSSLDALRAAMGDETGRWSWSRQLYGHVWSARRGAIEHLTAFGLTRNDQHCTIAGFEPGIPNPAWEYVAAWAARSAVFLNNEPERPTQTGELAGIIPVPPGKRFTLSEKQTLLFSGIATSYVGGGVVRIERSVTTYQKNVWGQGDNSYLDVETLFLLAHVLRRLRTRITSKYPRHALADDGTRFGTGKAVVTPNIIRAELIAEYSAMERDGKVENAAAFKAALVVERDPSNPNRINVLYPPDLVNQLRIFAVLAQFRLQYPTES